MTDQAPANTGAAPLDKWDLMKLQIRNRFPLSLSASEEILTENARLRAEVDHLKAERDKDRFAYLGALGHAIPCGHDGKLSDGTVPQNPIADAVVKLRAEPAERDRDHFAKSVALLAREIEHLKREAQGGIAPRVLELARQAMYQEHYESIVFGGTGHRSLENNELGFSVCPHPDCQAVRSSDEGREDGNA